MGKVLLVSMPFGALNRPALGLSQLKAELARHSVHCEIRYFAFLFAEFLGSDDYQWIQSDLPYTAFAGDWCFTESLYGPRSEEDQRYVADFFCGTWQRNRTDVQRLLRIRSLVEPFLERCMSEIDWRDYAIVGFTSTFEQNIASLSLAKRIKSSYPDIRIVFGGANWENEMGMELHRQFTFVDYACSGEAEFSFLKLVKHILKNKDKTGLIQSGIAGVVHRDGEKSVTGGHTELVTDMDTLVVPDFSDYFEQLNTSTVACDVLPNILIESSRGCWWGAKSHCTFCGLNGHSMAFRSKSAGRLLNEMDSQVERWRTDQIELVDNILDMHYFKNVLPILAESDRAYHLFYETKANLSRKQVELLSRAGVERIQPGIESLSDHVLKLIGKGTSALQNIQLLKWCKEYGVRVDWNLLYGFPGETVEDYQQQLELLASIRFLEPPGTCGPLRLDRFSPYFNNPESFGLKNLRPMRAYSFLYPVNAQSMSQIAYYFDFDYEQDVDPRGFAAEVIDYVDDWNKHLDIGTLKGVVKPDGQLVLIDTRNQTGMLTFALDGLERKVYEYCDQVHSLQAIIRHLGQHAEVIDETSVKAFLDSLMANQLMVTDGTRYLSLALGVKSNHAKATMVVKDIREISCEVV